MNCAGCLRIEGRLLKKCWWLSLHRKNAADWMFVLQERKYHGRQITLSRKVFRYLFYRKANIRVDVTEDVLAFGIVLHKFFTEEEATMNYTYIVECADGTLYTGWTNCLEKRMKAHNEGKAGAKYTRAKRPVKLVYYEGFSTREEAMSREYRIKQLSREKKLELMKL